MATIGTFTHDENGTLVGTLRTLTLDTPAQMEPITSEADNAPAYRIYAGEIELGAAWAKVAKETGRAYHQVRLDDPSFAAPVFANLIEGEDGTFQLIWSRPKPRPTAKASSRSRATTSAAAKASTGARTRQTRRA